MCRNSMSNMFASGLALVLVCLPGTGAAPAAGQDAGRVVTVEGGQLAGAPSPLGGEVMVYRGVPFAAPAGGRAAMASARAPGGLGGRARRDRGGAGVHAEPAARRGSDVLRRGRRPHGRGLPLPERLDGGGAGRPRPRAGLDPRRRAVHRQRRRHHLRRHAAGAARRRPGHHQLPARGVRLSRPPAVERRVRARGVGQLRPPRPGRRPRLGPAQHRGVRGATRRA